MKHTPGPWKAHFNVPFSTIPGHTIKTDDDIGHPVASLWEGGGTEGKPRQIANAKLIAAAPDMLLALRMAESALRNNNNIHHALKEVNEAITKATG